MVMRAAARVSGSFFKLRLLFQLALRVLGIGSDLPPPMPGKKPYVVEDEMASLPPVFRELCFDSFSVDLPSKDGYLYTDTPLH